jgi:hypothetical protein
MVVIVYPKEPMMYHAEDVTIRKAATTEWDAIDRLAQLDSAPPPPREAMLVAEVEGRMRAAVSLHNGYAVADPFSPSAGLVELLRARAGQLREGERDASRGTRSSVRSLGWLRGLRLPAR